MKAADLGARLAELHIDLPTAPAPAANYVPFTRAGTLVFVSGQLPRSGGQVASTGKLGAEVTLDAGKSAARLCGLNILAQLASACRATPDATVRCLRLTGYVNSAPGFHSQPQVVNGASDLMVEVFGDDGRHARTAIGVAELPSNASVEVDAIFELTKDPA